MRLRDSFVYIKFSRFHRLCVFSFLRLGFALALDDYWSVLYDPFFVTPFGSDVFSPFGRLLRRLTNRRAIA